MRIPCKSSFLLVVLCLSLAGCGGKQPEESPKTEGAKPAATQAAEPQDTATPAQKQPEAASAKPAQKKPAAGASAEPVQKQSAAASAAPVQMKPEATGAEPAKPSGASTSTAPAAPVAKERKAAPKDVAILKAGAMAAVKFEHKLHTERAGKKCETCHHASRPEKPGTAAQESCLNCHTRPPAAGMKTGLPAAFHNAAAQAGTCVDCHKRENAQGKKAPTKCLDCHKKENT